MPLSSPVYRDAPFSLLTIPGPEDAPQRLVWGHGWGQSSASLLPMAESLRPFAPSSLIDFPGFGRTPIPNEAWGTAEYADQVAGWMRSLPSQRLVWIGHSFGGRVGIQVAARHSGLLAGMVLIASAGIPRRLPAWQSAGRSAKRAFFTMARHLLPESQLSRLRNRVGSADYRQAGALRPIFSRVVREDLTEQAKAVRCPTLLLYGTLDTETPPEIGDRFHTLIAASELVKLEGFGHLNILTDGRHQVALRIRKFLESSLS